MKKKISAYSAYSLQMEELEMHVTSLKRPSLSTQNSPPTPKSHLPGALVVPLGLAMLWGTGREGQKPCVRGLVLTLAPLCAHSYSLSFVNCMVWPRSPDEGLIVLITVAHLLGHCAKCFVCSV